MSAFWNILKKKSGEQPEQAVNVFDNNFIDSIIYSQEVDYQIRSAASIWKFEYSGQFFKLKANPTILPTFAAFNYNTVIVIVDGVFYQEVFFADSEDEQVITLPASGIKTIELIEGLTSKPPSLGIIGTFLTEVTLYESQFTKINQVPVTDKLCFLGDSITVGGNADYPSSEGYAHLFRQDQNAGILGYGYGKVRDFAETSGLIDQTVLEIQDMLSNATNKKLVIALGTNDFGLDGTAASTIQTWYGNLLDAINAADSSIEIFCISPLLRSDDSTLLDDYRTAISNVCSARAYATYIEGKTILSLGDLDDGLHPTTAGHLKYYQAINTTILL